MNKIACVIVCLGMYLCGLFNGLMYENETPQYEVIETTTSITDISVVEEFSTTEKITAVATAYCSCTYCTDGDGITATGTIATEGRTIAVDPKVIPYGTEVIINGHTYIAEDCGGAIKGKSVDIYFDSHEDALEWGRKTIEIELVR